MYTGTCKHTAYGMHTVFSHLSAGLFVMTVHYSFSYGEYQRVKNNYIPRRKSGIYWIQVRRAAAAVEISLWTR